MNTIIVTAALAGAGLLANYDATAAAPITADSLHHRWTIGLHAMKQTLVMRYEQRSRGAEEFGPLLLTVGYRLRPRWTIEAGASYWRDQFSSSATFFSADGQQVEYRYDSRSWRATVPVRARYTLTRQPARRLQVDAMGGVVAAVLRDRYRNTQTTDGQPDGEYTGVMKGLGLAANIGVGARLGLGASRRAEIVGDLLLNKNIQPMGRSYTLYSNVYGLLETLTLGLRYRI